jgi:hypothetical protein
MPVRRLRRSLAVCSLSYIVTFSTDSMTGRNLLGGVFPLVTNAMFTNLGYPGASSLLGGIVSFCICGKGFNADLDREPCSVSFPGSFYCLDQRSGPGANLQV